MKEIIKCGHCGASFNDVEKAQAHAKTCGAEPGKKPQDDDDKTIYKCPKCNSVFANEKACIEHKKNCIC